MISGSTIMLQQTPADDNSSQKTPSFHFPNNGFSIHMKLMPYKVWILDVVAVNGPDGNGGA
jgi:hypothetical protein